MIGVCWVQIHKDALNLKIYFHEIEVTWVCYTTYKLIRKREKR